MAADEVYLNVARLCMDDNGCASMCARPDFSQRSICTPVGMADRCDEFAREAGY